MQCQKYRDLEITVRGQSRSLKMLPACFFYSTPVQPVSLGYTGQQLRHDPNTVYLGVTLDRTLSYRQHLTKTAAESYKAGIISWWNLLDPLGVPTLTPWDHLRWLCVTLWQNTAAQCGNVPHIIIITRIWHLEFGIWQIASKHANRMDARAHTSTLAECAPRFMTPRSQGFVGQSSPNLAHV